METKNKIRKKRRSQDTVRLVDDSTPFAIRESFNQLRTNIMYSRNDDGNGCPVYGITSAEMSVGKSTISSNLALSFAQLGKRVLLVDADMRRPTQNKIFGFNKDHAGLSELLSQIVTSDKDVVCSPCPNLTLVTSGTIPPNPSELMLGKRIGELIDKWRQEYDIVFIDLPPVGMVTDPITISSHISGYVMVITINKSDARNANDAIEQIKQVDAKIVGIVVNGSYAKGSDYRYGKGKYEYNYGYYYAETSEDK